MAVVVVFLVALTLRLLHVWHMRDTVFATVLMGDSRGYDLWAQQLAGGDWIGRDVFYQAPLYPYALGVFYALIGRDLFDVRVAQAVIGALSCVALSMAVRRFVSPRAGLVGGLMLACYPPAIFFDGLIQKSVLDVFFVCVALWAASTVATSGGTYRRCWLLGVVLGALALTRENALVLLAMAAVWAAWTVPNGSPSPTPSVAVRWRLSAAGAVLAAAFLVLLPVVARNYAVSGGWYLTTSQFGSNLYIGNHAGADGSYVSLRPGRGSPEFERVDATDLAEQAAGRSLTPSEVSSYWTGRALDFIGTQPLEWFALLARKARLLASRTEVIDTESQESHAEYSTALAVLGPVWHFGVLTPLAFIGILMRWGHKERLSLVYAWAIAYAATLIATFVVARYRLPLVPMLIVPATGVLALRDPDCREALRRAPAMTKALAGAGVLAVIFLTNWPVYGSASQRAITENNLGTALQDAGRTTEAIDRYRRALALVPDYLPAMNNLGTAERAAGNAAAAIATYDRALAAGADTASLHLNRGNALISQGRTDEAVASFRRALSIEPRVASTRAALANALYDQGTTALEQGAFERAVSAFSESLSLTPGSAPVHNNLGIALASQGKIAEAIVEWQAALRIDPTFADARGNLALALRAR